MKDYYKLLGIDDSADEKAIKKAYYKLAKKYHPDTKPGDENVEKKFKEISEAYTILSDKEKRSEYDKARNSTSFNESLFSDINFSSYEDIFNSYGNLFYGKNYDDLMKELFKGYTEKKIKAKGQNIEISLEIDLLESINGCKKNIEIKREEKVKTIEVSIPENIENGKKLKIKGMGEDGKNGGEKGDLIIKIKIKPDAYFTRDGNDIFVTESIPFSTAVLGGTYEIRTITGKVALNIPKGIKPGTAIKMQGKGVDGGDQYVKIQIHVPTNMNYEQEKLIKELQKNGL